MIDPKEVAIIGMGPAGVSAAIYLKRYGMIPFCFEKENVGGKTNKTDRIENYPGVLSERGPILASRFEEQLNSFDIKVNYREVKSLTLNEDHSFHIEYGKFSHDFKYVIIGNGLQDKEFHIPGEEKFHLRGISRCAICDGNFYKGKDVAVLGGGNSAFQEAIYLASLCSSVKLIAHHKALKASQKVIDQFLALNNTELLAPYDTISAQGENSLEQLVVRNNETNEERTLSVQGLFIYIGDAPVHPFVKIDGLCDEKGFFITDNKMMTKVNHLYAVGDCRNTLLRQVTTAVSDGSLCATVIHDDYQNSLE